MSDVTVSAVPAVPVFREEGSGGMDALVRCSRRLGADPALVLRGGGNTSLKRVELDVLGRPVPVLRVKGSGTDLATIGEDGFAGVKLPFVLPLLERTAMTDEAMVEHLSRSLCSPADPRPSIETLLHAFVPAASVFHSHADAVLALTNNADPEGTLDRALGPGVLRVPYSRPGFTLAREVGLAVRARPDAPGLVLVNHGLVTWGDDPEQALERHLALVERAQAWLDAQRPEPVFTPDPRLAMDPAARRRAAAALAPVVRSALGPGRAAVLRYCDDPHVLRFAGWPGAAECVRQGAATPDHILTTGRLPLLVPVDYPSDAAGVESAFRSALSAYREAYVAYVRRRDPAREPLDPAPRVVLVPGIGMFTGGRDAAEAALAGQIFLHTLRIMENAAALGGYRSLGEEDAFDAEYWPLELHKLSLPRRGGEMAGRVALVTGGGGAIGRAVCRALAGAGACVLVTDLDPASAAGAADAAAEGAGPDRVRPCGMDVTRERDVEAAFEDACLAFGGVDVVVSNAGVAYCASLEDTTLAQWQTSLAVNATGHFLVARAALRLFRRQGTGGSLVFVGTKNVTAPGRDFGAYSASKAAEAQLARVAAIEAGAMGVRVNVVNPDAVFGDSRLWSPALRASRAQSHGIAPDQLSDFYRGRSLLGVEVRAEDVADAVLFLAGPRASRTTGAMLAVDAGVREAFPR